ncbi:MAG: hypothetical protein E4G91_08060 [Candidatus Zixiibacteriota bacterium]|nr:MAG: hypothetical protein E4G91_08060 [candidate division Zixibacteria bacterium]
MTFRSIVLAVALLAVVLLPAVCFADEMADAYQSIKPFFDRLNNPSVSAGDRLPIIKCGTPYFLQARVLSPEYRQALGYTAGTRPYMQELSKQFDSPGGHFRIHYTDSLESRHLIDTTYGDHNSNGVPDYAEIVARIADSVWVHHIGTLGYHEPPNDGETPYGDGPRYDIFLIGLGEGLYGFTQPDEPAIVDGTHVRLTSWMALGNHYENFQGYEQRPIEAVQVTVAHEFFHAIQFWYDAKEPCTDANCTDVKQNPYWMEMSAVWMEEETYDNVNDYYGYLPYYFPYVQHSLRSFATSPPGDWKTLYCYGAGVFPIYLSQRFGKEIIKKAWEYCGEVSGSNFLESAIQAALHDVTGGQVDLPYAWTDYGRWLYFTETRTRPGQFFEEAANYKPMIPMNFELAGEMYPYIRLYSSYPIKPNQTGGYNFFPDGFGFNYLDFKTASLDSVLTFGFDGTSGNYFDWRLSVIAFDQNYPTTPVWVDAELHGDKDTFEVKNFNSYSDIIVIPTLVNPDLKFLNNQYRFSVDDTSIVITENRIAYGPSKIILSDPQESNRSLLVTVRVVEDATVDMKVYTAAAERIFSVQKHVDKNDEVPLRWFGKNDHGEEVSSGVYIVQIRVNNDDKTFKVLVIR